MHIEMKAVHKSEMMKGRTNAAAKAKPPQVSARKWRPGGTVTDGAMGGGEKHGSVPQPGLHQVGVLPVQVE